MDAVVHPVQFFLFVLRDVLDVVMTRSMLHVAMQPISRGGCQIEAQVLQKCSRIQLTD